VLHPEHWSFPTTPVARSGTHSGRIELHDTDTYGQFVRVEVEYTAPTAGFEGSELYYAWSTQLDSQNPVLPLDHETTFFESGGPVYHGVLSIHVNGTRVSFATSPEDGSWTEQWHDTMSYDAWHDFVLHVKWSLDPAVGYVELWYDGAQVVQKTMMRTMCSADGPTAMTNGLVNAFHQSLLLSPVPMNKPIEVVYVDRVRVGTQWADVVDSAVDAGAPPPDAGTADGGAPAVDAGIDAGHDAGQPPPDASEPDAGESNASGDGGGTEPNAPAPPHMTGATGAFGCSTSSGIGLLGLLAALLRRRRVKP